MSSAKTYALRDIVMLMNEAMDSFKKSGQAMTTAFESYDSMTDLVNQLRDANTHYERGMFRLSVAYEKLAKGARLEEEKEDNKEKKEHG